MKGQLGDVGNVDDLRGRQSMEDDLGIGHLDL
jgi:hypothetical protein